MLYVCNNIRTTRGNRSGKVCSVGRFRLTSIMRWPYISFRGLGVEFRRRQRNNIIRWHRAAHVAVAARPVRGKGAVAVACKGQPRNNNVYRVFIVSLPRAHQRRRLFRFRVEKSREIVVATRKWRTERAVRFSVIISFEHFTRTHNFLFHTNAFKPSTRRRSFSRVQHVFYRIEQLLTFWVILRDKFEKKNVWNNLRISYNLDQIP